MASCKSFGMHSYKKKWGGESKKPHETSATGNLAPAASRFRPQFRGPEGESHRQCGNSVTLIHRASANHGTEHADFGVLRGRNLGEVVGEDHEVGVFAEF